MPDQHEAAERYMDFMEKVNESLPAGTPDDERMRFVNEALENQFEIDLKELAGDAEQDLQQLADESKLEDGKTSDEEQTAEQLEAVRKSLG